MSRPHKLFRFLPMFSFAMKAQSPVLPSHFPRQRMD